MRAVLVARVSSLRQAENVSLDVQLQTMRRFVSDQGGVVVQEFTDAVPGTDSRYEDREGLQDALEAIAGCTANTLVIHDVTRGARDSAVFQRLLKDVYSRGGVIAVASERRVYENQDDADYGMHWPQSAASYELKQLRVRTQAAKRRAIDDGGYVWKPFFGYRLERRGKVKVLVPSEAQAAIVHEVLERLALGEQKHSIVRWLQSKAFDVDTRFVSTMADRAHLYAGGTEERQVTLSGELVRRAYRFPPVISHDLAQRVASKANANYRANRIATPFLGVARCLCGKGVVLARRYRGGSQVTCSTTKVVSYHVGKGRPAPFQPHRHSVAAKYVVENVTGYLAGVATGTTDIIRQMRELGRYQLPEDVAERLAINASERERLERQLLEAKELTHAARVFDARLGELEEERRRLEVSRDFVEVRKGQLQAIEERILGTDWWAFLESFVEGVDANDWRTVNTMLANVGVGISVDFTQPNVKRRISVTHDLGPIPEPDFLL